MRRLVAVIALVGILVLVNGSIAKKEKHLADGKIVYLQLAPVDPRSLMQGDYMALRFALADAIRGALPKSEDSRSRRRLADSANGAVVVVLDERNIATFQRIHGDEPLASGEILLRFRVRHGTVKFATNAFFFQEGTGTVYEEARYGQFRVNAAGEPLLVALHDEDLKPLAPGAES